MSRKTTWKEVHLTNDDDIHRLRANLLAPEYKGYTTNFEEGVGIIETNMPWSMFRNWFRFTGVSMPRDILTSDLSVAEMYPDEEQS